MLSSAAYKPAPTVMAMLQLIGMGISACVVFRLHTRQDRSTLLGFAPVLVCTSTSLQQHDARQHLEQVQNSKNGLGFGVAFRIQAVHSWIQTNCIVRGVFSSKASQPWCTCFYSVTRSWDSNIVTDGLLKETSRGVQWNFTVHDSPPVTRPMCR